MGFMNHSQENIQTGPELYIEVIHYPHSRKPTSTIIPLDNTQTGALNEDSSCLPLTVTAKPWAPFWTWTDFEFTEEIVTQGFHSKTISKLLAGFNGCWAPESYITIKNYSDYKDSLAAASIFGVQVNLSQCYLFHNIFKPLSQFKEGEITHIFWGHEYKFQFQYQDPWEWILQVVTDPTLAGLIIWHPVEKYL